MFYNKILDKCHSPQNYVSHFCFSETEKGRQPCVINFCDYNDQPKLHWAIQNVNPGAMPAQSYKINKSGSRLNSAASSSERCEQNTSCVIIDILEVKCC